MTVKWFFQNCIPTLMSLKLCKIPLSRKATNEHWLSHTTMGAYNTSEFVLNFLLLTSSLDLNFSILVKNGKKRWLMLLVSSRVLLFYPFLQDRSRGSNLIIFLRKPLAFWLFDSYPVLKQSRILLKTISWMYLIIIFLLYGSSALWTHWGFMAIVNECSSDKSSLTVLLQSHLHVQHFLMSLESFI